MAPGKSLKLYDSNKLKRDLKYHLKLSVKQGGYKDGKVTVQLLWEDDPGVPSEEPEVLAETDLYLNLSKFVRIG